MKISIGSTVPDHDLLEPESIREDEFYDEGFGQANIEKGEEEHENEIYDRLMDDEK